MELLASLREPVDAFFDGVSGTPDLELPEFTQFNNSLVFTFDVDNNGVQEIFASRPTAPGVTPLVRAYKWTPGGYVWICR